MFVAFVVCFVRDAKPEIPIAASLVYIEDPEYSSEVINTKTTTSKSCMMS